MPESPLLVESSEIPAAGDHPAGHRLTVSGEIDIASAPVLEQHFTELINQGSRLIVLDAGGIDFLDSSGLRTIVAATNDLEERGGQLVLEGVGGAVQKTLEVSGLLERYRTTQN